MPAATRFASRIQDMDDFAAALTWAGVTTFSENILQADGKYIATDQVRARDGDGLKLYNNAGSDGIFVGDSGGVAIGTTDLRTKLNICGALGVLNLISASLNGVAQYFQPTGTGGLDFALIATASGVAWGGGKFLITDGDLTTPYFAVVRSSGYVGINTTSPDQLLHVEDGHMRLTKAESSESLFLATYSDDAGDRSQILFRKSHVDTIDTNVATVSGEDLGQLTFQGVNTTTDIATALRITVEQDGDAGATFIPGRVQFWLATDAAAPAHVLTLKSTGRVGVLTDTPGAPVHVDQPSTTAAIPVLILDQADIDQPIVKIIGTAESGSADRSLVAASDFTTPGAIVAWEMVYVEDVGNRFTDAKYYRPLYAIPTA